MLTIANMELEDRTAIITEGTPRNSVCVATRPARRLESYVRDPLQKANRFQECVPQERRVQVLGGRHAVDKR